MDMNKKTRLPNIHPGEILVEEFLKPMGISQYRLAVVTGLPHSRVTDLVKQRRGVTADTALRFSRCFGTTPEFWLNLQHLYDITEARRENEDAYEAIPLLTESST
jgi:addiction module HigA family antidote